MSTPAVSIKLSERAAEILNARLTSYADALQVTIAALGLEGDWKYDPITKSLLMVVPDTAAGT